MICNRSRSKKKLPIRAEALTEAAVNLSRRKTQWLVANAQLIASAGVTNANETSAFSAADALENEPRLKANAGTTRSGCQQGGRLGHGSPPSGPHCTSIVERQDHGVRVGTRRFTRPYQRLGSLFTVSAEHTRV